MEKQNQAKRNQEALERARRERVEARAASRQRDEEQREERRTPPNATVADPTAPGWTEARVLAQRAALGDYEVVATLVGGDPSTTLSDSLAAYDALAVDARMRVFSRAMSRLGGSAERVEAAIAAARREVELRRGAGRGPTSQARVAALATLLSEAEARGDAASVVQIKDRLGMAVTADERFEARVATMAAELPERPTGDVRDAARRQVIAEWRSLRAGRPVVASAPAVASTQRPAPRQLVIL